VGLYSSLVDNIRITLENGQIKCKCGFLDRTGLPCHHLITYNNGRYDNFIDNVYRVQQYINCYKTIMHPASSEKLKNTDIQT
jgi:hypothetical protein